MFYSNYIHDIIETELFKEQFRNTVTEIIKEKFDFDTT